jgi:hypothetical protein
LDRAGRRQVLTFVTRFEKYESPGIGRGFFCASDDKREGLPPAVARAASFYFAQLRCDLRPLCIGCDERHNR